MNTKRANAITLIVFVCILFVLSGCVLEGAFEQFELKVSDWILLARGQQRPQPNIVIVSIDQSSLSITPWPWPRDYLAKILSYIADGKPSVVGINIVFDQSSSNELSDAKLAQVLDETNNDVLAEYFEYERISPGAFRFVVRQPVATFLAKVSAIGMSNILLDRDGIARKLTTRIDINGQTYTTLSNEVVLLYLKSLGKPSTFKCGIGENLAINFRGPANTFTTISAASVADGEIPSNTFSGKIVLVGATDETLDDAYLTPFSKANSLLSGTEIMANAIDNIVSGDCITRIGVGGSVVGLPIPSEEVQRFGIYSYFANDYITKLFRSDQMYALGFVVVGCLVGFVISNTRQLSKGIFWILGTAIGVLVSWTITMLVAKVQFPLITPEAGLFAGMIVAIVRQGLLKLPKPGPKA